MMAFGLLLGKMGVSVRTKMIRKGPSALSKPAMPMMYEM